eukprot:1706559-Rhodomonas_salina.1
MRWTMVLMPVGATEGRQGLSSPLARTKRREKSKKRERVVEICTGSCTAENRVEGTRKVSPAAKQHWQKKCIGKTQRKPRLCGDTRIT